MKAAREVLTNQKYGFSKEQFESALNAMQEYARIQIEKDREEVKKLIKTELQDFPDMASELIFSIDNTPINLD